MSYQCFKVTFQNRIAHIQLSRPEKRNSMIPEFWDELPEIINDIDSQVKARVIVISSTGPHFSSGMDVTTFAQSSEREAGADSHARRVRGEAFYRNVERLQNTFSCLENCRLPVIAAIQGGCIGGAVDMITACDMRYATEDAFISIFEVNIGMTADVGTFPRLVKLIPEGIVRELAYTGRRMSAAEATQAGLVNAVFKDQETMLEEVMGIAAEIARKAPLAVYGSKRMINYSRDHTTADGLDYIRTWNASMLQREEIAEAMAANKENREGDFAELPTIPGVSGEI
ncbi:MAG: crotonase/enoyl-CoA hydratase family protein [Gammaproteobacteria bacterium]|nr:crotonase/enoyl-CoA hydratase family protein [Gammaproteobacteria bacterium]